MKSVQKRSCLLMLAFFLAYAGLTFAAPVAPVSDKLLSATVVAQAQPEKPVDCKKYPKHPDCQKK